MHKPRPATLSIVLGTILTLSLGPVVPVGTSEPVPDCVEVLDASVPELAARDGTPLVVPVRLNPCAWETYTEIRGWLGNETHQASRVHDGDTWTTSQHYTDLDNLMQQDDLTLLPLQANPDSTHAPALIHNTDTTQAWLRLRDATNTTTPLALGTIQWADKDRVTAYWGNSGVPWLAVEDGEGRLLGSALQDYDKDNDPLPDGFAWIALPEAAPASAPSPVDPRDLLVVRMIPKRTTGGSLIELLVKGDLNDLGGLRVESRHGGLILPPLPVQTGDLVQITDEPDVLLPSLERQILGTSWPEPWLVSWADENPENASVDVTVEADGRFQFARSGGSIQVVYGDVVLDSFAYGDTDAPQEWGGRGVEATRIQARVYLRAHDGTRFVDTDQAHDWQRPRIHREHQTDHETRWFTVEGPVRAWVCPDRCHEEALLRIEQAQASLDVNLYELTLPRIVEALAEAAGRGVDVRVLVHEAPIGASPSRMDRIAWAVDRLLESGAQVRTLDGVRFDVNHAKYMVVDEAWTLVTTENAVSSGWPGDGASGNRGHGVAVHDPALAQWVAQVFESDYAHPVDAFDVTGRDLHPDHQEGRYTPYVSEPSPAEDRLETLVVDGGFPVAPILAPDHLGDPERNPIVETLTDARENIGLAQMNLPLSWSRPGHRQDSPLTAALITAGEQDVAVTGTLAAAFIEADRDGNHRTAAALHQTDPRIDLRLGGAPPEGVVHAKTWWTDPGTPHAVAITGSANGNLASQALNRELDLMLAHPEIAAYWAQAAAADHENAASYTEYAPENEGDRDPQAAANLPPGAWLPAVLLLLLLLAGRRRPPCAGSPPPDPS